jgi:hypothetical protein
LLHSEEDQFGKLTMYRHSRVTKPIRFRHGFLLLCLIGVVVACGKRAEATCGDYLHHPGMTKTHYSQGMLAPGILHESDSGQQFPRPHCSGPQCRQNNHIPLLPSREAPPVPPNEAILGLILPVTDSLMTCGFHSTSARLTSRDHLDRIFRPPRSV